MWTNRQGSGLPKTFLRVSIVAWMMGGLALGRAQAQTGPPTPPQAQPQQNQDSLGDAARKAKTGKGKSKARKVYTDENLPAADHSISVVGQAGEDSPQAKNSEAKSASSEASADAKKEDFWRGKARKIRDQMEAMDQEIVKLKEDIKKNGASGFDASSGYQKNVIYVDDKNARLKELEKKRETLDVQMDQLMEEGRKAGASPSWFR
jgi:chaperonin cofactor prefoldin